MSPVDRQMQRVQLKYLASSALGVLQFDAYKHFSYRLQQPNTESFVSHILHSAYGTNWTVFRIGREGTALSLVLVW